MNNIFYVKSHLIEYLVTEIRDIEQRNNIIKSRLSLIAIILLNESSRCLPLIKKEFKTWKGNVLLNYIENNKIVFIPILRGGLPMLEGIQEVFPDAEYGFLGMEKNQESLISKINYKKIPNIKGKIVYVLDTMVGTGGTIINAINELKKDLPSKIIVLSVISGPQSYDNLEKEHPDVVCYCCTQDKEMNQNGFLLPGTGDMGDRCYNGSVFE